MKILRKFLVCKLLSLLGTFVLGNLFFSLATPTLQAEGWYPGRLLVKPKSGVSLETFHKTAATKLKMKLLAGDEPWEVVEFDPLTSVQEMAKTYIKSGLVEYAHPDYWVEPAIFPNDPHSQDPSRAYNLQLIDAPAAWSCYNDSSSILVASVDTGARFTHEDLAANIWVNPNEIPDNNIDDDRNGYVDDVHGINVIGQESPGSPMDDSGHGSHVTGIIGACGNNSKGVCGMSWNAKIMVCRFMNSNTGSIAGAVECLIYARTHGARIINASWTVSDDAKILRSEVKSLQSKGILLVCAAGNKSSQLDSNPLYPACYSTQYPNVISVGNSDNSDQRVYDSCYSTNYVQLFAPGKSIYSTGYYSDKAYTTLSGTSMSAPHVTGALALYLTANPGANYLQARNALLNSVDACPKLKDYCSTGGRLNLARLLSTKEIPEIQWATPEPQPYGTILSSEQLNATCSLPGTLTYSPTEGTLLEPGTHFLLTSFTPADPSTTLPSDKTVSLTIQKITPDLTWETPAPISYGTALSEVQLSATAPTAGSFIYTPEAGTLLDVGTQELSVLFIPTDSVHYNTGSASVSLVVEKALPTLSWEPPAPITYGTLLSDAQLNATASLPGTFLYTPPAGTLLEAGEHTLSTTFTPEDTTHYTSASASVSLQVIPAVVTPTLTWTTDKGVLTLFFTGTLYESEDLQTWKRIDAQETYQVELSQAAPRYYRSASE